jgi:hypothetical protein
MSAGNRKSSYAFDQGPRMTASTVPPLPHSRTSNGTNGSPSVQYPGANPGAWSRHRYPTMLDCTGAIRRKVAPTTRTTSSATNTSRPNSGRRAISRCTRRSRDDRPEAPRGEQDRYAFLSAERELGSERYANGAASCGPADPGEWSALFGGWDAYRASGLFRRRRPRPGPLRPGDDADAGSRPTILSLRPPRPPSIGHIARVPQSDSGISGIARRSAVDAWCRPRP